MIVIVDHPSPSTIEVLDSFLTSAGFPPIREIREFRENLKTFSSQGNQGKTGGFQTFLRLLNLRSCQEIAIFA